MAFASRGEASSLHTKHRSATSGLPLQGRRLEVGTQIGTNLIFVLKSHTDALTFGQHDSVTLTPMWLANSKDGKDAINKKTTRLSFSQHGVGLYLSI